jgi:hypothetical protein
LTASVRALWMMYLQITSVNSDCPKRRLSCYWRRRVIADDRHEGGAREGVGEKLLSVLPRLRLGLLPQIVDRRAVAEHVMAELVRAVSGVLSAAGPQVSQSGARTLIARFSQLKGLEAHLHQSP